MKLKKIFAGLFLFCAVCLAGCSGGGTAGGSYEVILPEEYKESGAKYPVVYVLPQDGYEKDDSGISELLTENMAEGNLLDVIIVKPAFEEDADITAAMKTIVDQVDSEYNTIKNKKYRALMGTGAGGYMAYKIALEDRDVYGMMASIRGDFASDENPWAGTFGSVSDVLDKMKAFASAYFEEVYTYMDAPVDDPWTNMEGSTNDLGAVFIEMGTSSEAHEFTVRPGKFGDEFLKESMIRVSDRFTKFILKDVFTGSVNLENATLSEEEASAKVEYSLNVANTFNNFTPNAFDLGVKVSVLDPITGEVLSEATDSKEIIDKGTYRGDLEVENKINDKSSDVIVSITAFGGEMQLAKTAMRRGQGNVLDGDTQMIDLEGDWYFKYVGTKEKLDIASITPDVYESWSVVQPGMGNWTKGYGNIDDTTVKSTAEYFEYMITGNGYYVKEFELPQEFDSTDITLSIGYVDDRCEVYLNGKKVGSTGMNDAGMPNGETTWAQLSEFALTPSDLKNGGMNTLIVRAWNDEPYGAGGWYKGPISLTGTKSKEDTAAAAADEKQYFYEETFESNYTEDGRYLIYLPQDYYETDRFYPTMYLLHQFNSDHTSYKADNIDIVLNEGIENSLYDEMIVVIPNSAEESWWTGVWEKMVTEELIPHIDAKYRTIDDARYRMTAGCSMGGQGAFGVGLTNPEYFSGAASFFGALSMPPRPEESALVIAGKESKEYLDYFSWSFICGNQDSYGFGIPAIELNQLLTEKEVAHNFFIENGGHDSVFYIPYFNDSIGYVRSNMYQADESVDKLVSGKVEVNGTKVKVSFEALSGMEDYFNVIPASSYTQNANPELNIPLVIQVAQDGKVVHTQIERGNKVTADQMSASYEYDFAKVLAGADEFEVVVKAAVFDRIVELK